MELKAIVAVDEKWAIGKDNKLLYSIPEDMKFFMDMTKGTVVISGKNNLLSFPGGRPLKNRRNIILSRTLPEGEGYEVARDMEEMFSLIKDETRQVFVVGGGEVYRELLPYCAQAYVTKMFRDFKGEVFFPDLDQEPGWRLADQGEMKEYEGMKFSFNRYDNDNVIRAGR